MRARLVSWAIRVVVQTGTSAVQAWNAVCMLGVLYSSLPHRQSSTPHTVHIHVHVVHSYENHKHLVLEKLAISTQCI